MSEKKKLKIISKFGSVENIKWKKIKPNLSNDWIKKRKTNYENTIPLIENNEPKSLKFFKFIII